MVREVVVEFVFEEIYTGTCSVCAVRPASSGVNAAAVLRDEKT